MNYFHQLRESMCCCRGCDNRFSAVLAEKQGDRRPSASPRPGKTAVAEARRITISTCGGEPFFLVGQGRSPDRRSIATRSQLRAYAQSFSAVEVETPSAAAACSAV